MSSFIAILAIAGGFGALVGILVGSRRPQRVTEGPEAASAAVSVGASLGTRMRDIAPTGYVGMLARQVALAGRPPAWTVDRILMAKPILGIVAWKPASASSRPWPRL